MKLIEKIKSKKKKNKYNEKIKKEKQKIKEARKTIKEERKKRFYNSKIGKLLTKISKPKVNHISETKTLKEQIFSMLYFETLGFILCLILFFVLSGGKNYIKLYNDLSKLINVYDTISSNYYGDLDKEELIDNAIDSMLTSIGDSYTTYSNKEDTDAFLESVSGTYEGIGCTVAMNQNDDIYVVEVFEDSPSQKAGLQANDIILKVDGTDYTNKTSEDVANYVKESTNDKVKVIIKREDKEQEITIVREKVSIPSVTSKVVEFEDKKIGYIDISIFSSVTTEQFKDKLEKLEKKDIQGLVIDVRNDTGGYLSTVTDIASMFLKKGQVIYQLEDAKNTEKIKDTTKEKRTYPVAVLVNNYSASASEILASAIKESYGGYIVGTNTYGKGTVQKTKRLSDGSMIKYTIQKWLTPNGNWINETGVKPTHELSYSTDPKEDNQLQKALSLIASDLK